MHIGLFRHSWVYDTSKPKSDFCHLSSLKIKTQIVHLVALVELYNAVHLDLHSRHSIDMGARNMGSVLWFSGRARVYEGKLTVRPSKKTEYSLSDSAFNAEHESDVSFSFWRKSDDFKKKDLFSPCQPAHNVVLRKPTAELFNLDIYISKDVSR